MYLLAYRIYCLIYSTVLKIMPKFPGPMTFQILRPSVTINCSCTCLAVYNIFVSLNMLCPLATTTKYECHWLQIAFLLLSIKYCGVLAITNFGIISYLLNKKEKHFCSDKISYLCFVVMEYSYMFDILFINNLAL